jgi:Cu/Ag efflux pump CusA
VSRVLNFGAQAPVEVEQLGYDLKDAQAVAREVARTLADTRGIADVFIELRRHGAVLHEAVVRAGRTRLRPIVTTSLTTLVGLFPIALGIDVGSEAHAPLARAVIGGLAVSTVLTLVLIPTLHVILEERFPRRVEIPDGELAPQGDTA